MIIKSISRRSNPGQLISYATRYILKDGKEAKNKEHMTVLIEHNLRSHTVEGYIQAFKENESFRLHPRKDSVTLFHTIISFSPKDKEVITLPMLTDIGIKFISLRGTNCLHLGVVHEEKAHSHLHFVTSGVATNGKSSRMSNAEFKHLLNELEAYQQTNYPELVHSVNRHDKAITSDKELELQTLKELQSIRDRSKELEGLARSIESNYREMELAV